MTQYDIRFGSTAENIRYAQDGASSSEVVPVVDPSFTAILVSASEILWNR